MERSPELVVYIVDEINYLDIAGYLKEEVANLCKYLHQYKLKNIWENIDTLKEYLLFLDAHSTKQMSALDYIVVEEQINPEMHDISYYLSQHAIDQIGESAFAQKLEKSSLEISYVMQAVKWFLLLTADEFCNATRTRLSITRKTWQTQDQIR